MGQNMKKIRENRGKILKFVKFNPTRVGGGLLPGPFLRTFAVPSKPLSLRYCGLATFPKK